jgi:hypothetical protein
VTTPCSLLTTMAGYYRITPGAVGRGVAGEAIPDGPSALDVPIGYLLTEHAYTVELLDEHGTSTRWHTAPALNGTVTGAPGGGA